MTCTSWTPPAPAVAAIAFPREKRKYHSTQTMATAPSAVTTIWVDVTRPSLACLCARGSAPGRPGRFDPHGVERAPHERQRDEKECAGKHETQRSAPLRRERNRELDREQAEERRELDDRIHRDRGRVLERVADGIAHNRSVVQRRAFLLQLGLDDLLGVVPCPPRIRHEDGLVETEQRDRDQVADEEVRLEERERE